MSEQRISREDVEKQTTYVGPNWWPIRQLARNLLAADDALKQIEHGLGDERLADAELREIARAAMLLRSSEEVKDAR